MTSIVATTSAITQAAYVSLADLPRSKRRKKSEEAVVRVKQLRARGYNTLVVPLMEEGLVHATAAPEGRWRRRGGLSGPAVDALKTAAAQPRTSAWLYIDPLSAGPPKSSHLSAFSEDHRDWLIRNTSGRIHPLGNQIIPDPLYSWLSRDYRRHIGDLIYALGEKLPFTGIVIDLRHYPGISENSERWYCCSFQSQEVAERELKMSFETILARSGEAEIHEWQRLVVRELRGFIVYLASRLNAVRSDLSWKLMAPRPHEPDAKQAPWSDWFAEGLFDELLLPARDEHQALDEAMARISARTPVPRLLLPFFHDEHDVLGASEALRYLPCPGYLVMRPGHDPQTVLPDAFPRWERGGALEDSPVDAARALARYLEEEFGGHAKLGRFFRRLGHFLDDFAPTPENVARLVDRADHIRHRLFEGEVPVEDEKRPLLREVDLLVRLLTTLKPRLPVV